MTNEESIKQGICPDCGAPMKAWTQQEIDAAKDDLGMDESEDFFDCCNKCVCKYLDEMYRATQDTDAA